MQVKDINELKSKFDWRKEVEMYRNMVLKFHHGVITNRTDRWTATTKICQEPAVMVETISRLCKRINRIYNTNIIINKVYESDDEWMVYIKCNKREYFNVICEEFYKKFSEVVTNLQY